MVTDHEVRALADLPPARSTLLDITPRQLLALGGDRVPARYRRTLRRYRYGPGVFKIDWALSEPVPWTNPAVRRAGTVHLGGTIAEIADAEAAVLAGRVPDRPFVLFVQATVADPSRAPDGRHTGWAYCHVPNGSTVDCTEAIEAQVERFAPGFRDTILARHTMHAAGMEAYDANYVGGDINGGAGTLRQIFTRPAVSLRPWVTPDPGRLPVLVGHPARRRGARDVRLARGPGRPAPRPAESGRQAGRFSNVQDVVAPDCTVIDAVVVCELAKPFEHRISYR